MSESSHSGSSRSSKVYPLLDQNNLPINGGEKIGIERSDFDVTWRHIKYLVEFSATYRLMGRALGQRIPKRLLILKGVSGHIRSGQLMGVMGPSGAGKSTLLECIVGWRAKGLTGLVMSNATRSLKMAFVPQHDQFFEALTVRECLHFASKVHGANEVRQGTTSLGGLGGLDHGKRVEQMIEKLGLSICADTACGRCSGGQQKRIMIAQELLGHPDILVLDEPTSGLDSAACFLVINILKELVEDHHRPIAIMLTIHQPSYRVLSKFDVVYGLSNQGKCIYAGPPDDLIDVLADSGAPCPDNYNPAEFLIDVASGDFGVNCCMSLAARQEKDFATTTRGDVTSAERPLEEVAQSGVFPFYEHFVQVLIRSVRVTVRDPWLFWLRFASHTFLPLLIAVQMEPGIGERGGCPPKFDSQFDPSELEAIQIHNKRETDAVFDNSGAIFLGMLIIVFTSVMPTVLTFPGEMSIFVKEKSNQWYGVTSYYAAKTVADVPFQLLFPIMFGTILFTVSGQVTDLWRFFAFLGIITLMAFAGQSQGLLVGALSMRHVTAGVYLAPFTMMPLFLFAGYFLRIKDVMPAIRPVTMLSYARYGLESVMGVIYGFHRCGKDAEANMAEARASMLAWLSDMLGATDGRTGVTVNFVDNLVKTIAGDFVGDDGKVRSIILNHYSVDDSYVLPAIGAVLLIMVVLRVATYFIVVKQANSKL